MNSYRVVVKHGTVVVENIIVRARSLDESFDQAILVLEKYGVKYGDIKTMSSLEVR